MLNLSFYLSIYILNPQLNYIGEKMGVKGLTKFILENPDLLRPYKLHDSHIIIDGDNLVFPLYFSNVHVICGGDYTKYAEYIRKYFHMFLECSVTPIVVFDGGYDKSGMKMNTIFKRTVDRLTSVKYIAEGKNYNRKVLPILAYDVFICILNELDIPFVISDYEADDQVAALANYYKCPVISDDSDFFIFNVPNGFIIRDSIEKTVSLDIDSHGKAYKYLNCYIYYIDEFISYFPGIKKSVLPLFGTLIGNDYVDQDEFEYFLTKIQLPKEERMISLLYWLKNKSLDDAINHILQYCNNEKQKYVKSIIKSAIASYDFSNCKLSHIINQKLKLYDSECKLLFSSRLITPCGNSLPLDFIMKYHSGYYVSYFPNIIVLHKLFLNPQIDDLNFLSSYTCARYIRRVIYGILIHHDVKDGTCQNEKCFAPIEEYDRHEGRLSTELVEPIFIIEEIGTLPKINELNNLKKAEAKLLLMKVLGVDIDFTENLPAEWQLLIACINYWLCNSVPCSTVAFLYALIINLIYCDVIMYNNPYQNKFKCRNKSTKGNHKWLSITGVLSKITQLELKYAAKNMKKYLCKPSINHNNPICVEILHSYSQLQSCIMATISLNKLLGSCMKNPDIHRCLNGSLLYNLTKDFYTWSNPKLLIDNILGRKTALSTLFRLLDLKLHQGVPSHYILKMQ